MLTANKQKNANTKSEIESQISNLSIVDDEEQIQQSIKDEIEEMRRQEELKKQKAEEERNAKERSEKLKVIIKHLMVFIAIGLGIILCIIIIIAEQKKKRKGDINNGRKEINKN